MTQTGDPRPRTPSTPGRDTWMVLAVMGAAVAATVLATSRFGVGLTPDSVLFVDSARSLADGLGYARQGQAMTIFPPGYPAILALGEELGIGAVATARVVGVASFVLTTGLGYVLLRRHLQSPRLAVVGTVVIGCSAILLEVFEEALSEHLFIVVVLLAVLTAEELVARPRDRRLLAAAVALVWAGFALRYAGVVLVPFLTLVVVAALWRESRLRALAHSAAFAVVALSAPVLWMARNVDAGSGPMGGRHSAAATLPTNLRRTVTVLSGWVSVDAPASPLRVVALAAGIAAGAGILLLVLPARSRVAARTREIWPVALFVVLYLVYLVGSASVVAFAPINDRYLIPVYVPMVVLGARAFEAARGRLGPSGRLVLTLAASVWLVLGAMRFGEYTLRSARNGAGGYSTVAWNTSELMAEVRGLDPEVLLISNDGKAVQLHAQRIIGETANKTFSGSTERTNELARLVELVRCEGTVELAWFSRSGTRRGRLYSPEELARYVRVVRTARLADGDLYELSPLPSPGSGAAAVDADAPCVAGATATPAEDEPET